MPSLFPASKTTYDDTSTSLGSNRVQGAIQALKTLIDNAVTAISGKVSKSGDTMSGILNVNTDSTTQARFCKSNTGTSAQASDIVIGNNIPDGTQGASLGRIMLYGATDKYVLLRVKTGGLTDNRIIYLPDKAGTIALTNDIPSIYSNTSQLTDMTWGLYVTSFTISNSTSGYFTNKKIIASLKSTSGNRSKVKSLFADLSPSSDGKSADVSIVCTCDETETGKTIYVNYIIV